MTSHVGLGLAIFLFSQFCFLRGWASFLRLTLFLARISYRFVLLGGLTGRRMEGVVRLEGFLWLLYVGVCGSVCAS